MKNIYDLKQRNMSVDKRNVKTKGMLSVVEEDEITEQLLAELKSQS